MGLREAWMENRHRRTAETEVREVPGSHKDHDRAGTEAASPRALPWLLRRISLFRHWERWARDRCHRCRSHPSKEATDAGEEVQAEVPAATASAPEGTEAAGKALEGKEAAGR